MDVELEKHINDFLPSKEASIVIKVLKGYKLNRVSTNKEYRSFIRASNKLKLCTKILTYDEIFKHFKIKQ